MNRVIAIALASTLMAACTSALHTQSAPQESLRASMMPQAAVAYAVAPPPMTREAPVEREQYASFKEQGITSVAEQPVSTFSADVDTAAYANARQSLLRDRMPTRDAVRIEEFVNYFDYGQSTPQTRETPFSVSIEMAPTPWNARTQLLKVGIKGYPLKPEEIPPANLVFLIDVSGSMNGPDRLDLLKQSMGELVSLLRPQDRISLVVYSGRTATLFEGESGTEKTRIRRAIDSLYASGSTDGGSAIQTAYAIAERHFIQGGVNRIIMGTDGDFNVGIANVGQLKSFVAEKRKTGVSLSLLGVGRGNLNDELMQSIANVGDGKYAFLDSIREGRRVLIQQMAGSLATIARDVKLQMEFNPARVSEYRLIGYEKRALSREDFANDKVDAGDIGAGHAVTALYEIALTGSGGERLPALRYADKAAPTATVDEYAHLALRYKAPAGGDSKVLTFPVTDRERHANGSAGFRLAAAVAAFGQQLRGGTYLGDYTWDQIARLAESAGDASQPDRAELIHLVRVAESIASRTPMAKAAEARGE